MKLFILSQTPFLPKALDGILDIVSADVRVFLATPTEEQIKAFMDDCSIDDLADVYVYAVTEEYRLKAGPVLWEEISHAVLR